MYAPCSQLPLSNGLNSSRAVVMPATASGTSMLIALLASSAQSIWNASFTPGQPGARYVLRTGLKLPAGPSNCTVCQWISCRNAGNDGDRGA